MQFSDQVNNLTKLNILFLGQKPIGEYCFDTLVKKQNKQIEIKAAVANPTNLNWWKDNKIKSICSQEKIMFISNEKRNESLILQVIKDLQINFIISVQHPWILSANLLHAVNYNALNLHNAKIPDYKGYNCYNHAILNGEKKYYSTIHWMIPEVDMGAIAFEEWTEIDETTTCKSLVEKAHIAATKCFNNLLEVLSTNPNEIPRISIVGTGNFYSKSDLEQFREIKDITNPEEIDLKSRAFYNPPYENAYFKIGNKKYYIIPNL